MAQEKVVKSEAEWREQLGPQRYEVCRRGGTERPFSGRYWDCKEDGLYRCACCGQALFDSKAKFESGTGWPSFHQALAEGRLREETDTSLGMVRTEVLCARCDAHLGHVFPDGPAPSGLRYCLNSAAIELGGREDE